MASSACAARPEPDAGLGAVRVGVVAPREQGPRGQVVGVGYLTAALVRESLIAIGPDGVFQPRLVERWERSDDGRTWRFFLKKAVQFHDGAPLTSATVVPALQEQLSRFGGATSIVSIDDTTFEILQDRPSSLLLDAMAAVSIGRGPTNVLGTGPFVSMASGVDGIGFRAFPSHHRGAPSVEEVGLHQYDDQRGAWAALMRSEVDVLYEVSPEAREFVDSESTVSVSSFLRPYTYLLGFNLNHPAFRDKRVRRAMNLAVDRDEIVRTALKGHGEVAFDHLWPRNWAVMPDRSAYAPDRQAALRLLREASGRSLAPAAPGRMPSRLSFKCLVYQPLEKFALVIQRQLALVDVDMQVELLSAPEMGQRIGTGRFEAFLFELANARMLGYTYTFWHSMSPDSVRTGYAAADDALDLMRYARTPDETKAAVRKIQDVMRDDPPAIFIAYPQVARAVNRRFEIPSGEEDIFHTIARWKLAPTTATDR
ncbi:MAG: ABC transporter substrate-binding protein [Acidobacteriota bacterium]|nr:ABC transporter substrate-binding protein [Acidobacteriota bacterium]